MSEISASSGKRSNFHLSITFSRNLYDFFYRLSYSVPEWIIKVLSPLIFIIFWIQFTMVNLDYHHHASETNDRQVLYYSTVIYDPFFWVDKYLDVYIYIFYISFSFYFLIMGYGVYCYYQSSLLPEYMFTILSVIIKLSTSILFFPSLSIFFKALRCEISTFRVYDFEEYEHHHYCYQIPYLPVYIMGVCMVILVVTLAAISSCYMSDNVFGLGKSFRASPNGRFDLNVILFSTFIFCTKIFLNSPYAVIREFHPILAAIGIFILYLKFIFFLPYYNCCANLLVSFFLALSLAFAQFGILMETRNQEDVEVKFGEKLISILTDLGFYLVLSTLCLIIRYSIYCCCCYALRKKHRSKWSQRLVRLGGAQQFSLYLKHCSIEELEDITRKSIDKLFPRSVKARVFLIFRFLTLLSRQKPDNNNEMNVIADPLRLKVFIRAFLNSQILQQKLAPDTSFYVFIISQRVMEMELSNDASVSKQLSRASKQEVVARKCLKKIFGLYVSEKIEIRTLSSLFAELNEKEKSADQIYRMIMKKHSKDPKVLSRYGKFLYEVKLQVVLADSYLQQARRMENSLSRMNSSKNMISIPSPPRDSDVHVVDISDREEDDDDDEGEKRESFLDLGQLNRNDIGEDHNINTDEEEEEEGEVYEDDDVEEKEEEIELDKPSEETITIMKKKKKKKKTIIKKPKFNTILSMSSVFKSPSSDDNILNTNAPSSSPPRVIRGNYVSQNHDLASIIGGHSSFIPSRRPRNDVTNPNTPSNHHLGVSTAIGSDSSTMYIKKYLSSTLNKERIYSTYVLCCYFVFLFVIILLISGLLVFISVDIQSFMKKGLKEVEEYQELEFEIVEVAALGRMFYAIPYMEEPISVPEHVSNFLDHCAQIITLSNELYEDDMNKEVMGKEVFVEGEEVYMPMIDAFASWTKHCEVFVMNMNYTVGVDRSEVETAFLFENGVRFMEVISLAIDDLIDVIGRDVVIGSVYMWLLPTALIFLYLPFIFFFIYFYCYQRSLLKSMLIIPKNFMYSVYRKYSGYRDQGDASSNGCVPPPKKVRSSKCDSLSKFCIYVFIHCIYVSFLYVLAGMTQYSTKSFQGEMQKSKSVHEIHIRFVVLDFLLQDYVYSYPSSYFTKEECFHYINESLIHLEQTMEDLRFGTDDYSGGDSDPTLLELFYEPRCDIRGYDDEFHNASIDTSTESVIQKLSCLSFVQVMDFHGFLFRNFLDENSTMDEIYTAIYLLDLMHNEPEIITDLFPEVIDHLNHSFQRSTGPIYGLTITLGVTFILELAFLFFFCLLPLPMAIRNHLKRIRASLMYLPLDGLARPEVQNILRRSTNGFDYFLSICSGLSFLGNVIRDVVSIRSNSCFTLLKDVPNYGIVIFDNQFRILFLNDECRKTFGLRKRKIAYGFQFTDFLEAEQRRDVNQWMKSRTSDTYSGEVTMKLFTFGDACQNNNNNNEKDDEFLEGVEDQQQQQQNEEEEEEGEENPENIEDDNSNEKEEEEEEDEDDGFLGKKARKKFRRKNQNKKKKKKKKKRRKKDRRKRQKEKQKNENKFQNRKSFPASLTIVRNHKHGQNLGIIKSMIKEIQQRNLVEYEKERSMELLYNILPKSIAKSFIKTQKSQFISHEAVSVVFQDLVGFTAYSKKTQPEIVCSVLNQLFKKMDDLCIKNNMEKIKTIGDAYLCACGIPEPQMEHVYHAFQYAIDCLNYVYEFNHVQKHDFHIRTGIHSGKVCAGVIGKLKFQYDIWGDAVNTASRMESTGEPDKIQVSRETYSFLYEGRDFLEREVFIKGKGMQKTYLYTVENPYEEKIVSKVDEAGEENNMEEKYPSDDEEVIFMRIKEQEEEEEEERRRRKKRQRKSMAKKESEEVEEHEDDDDDESSASSSSSSGVGGGSSSDDTL